jgi:hypothetical protein
MSRSEYNSVDIQDLDLRQAMNTFFGRVEAELARDIGARQVLL